MRVLIWIVLALVLSSCAGARDAKHLTLAELAAANQTKSAQLSVGMSKSDVVALMGTATAKTGDGIVNNPWSTEVFKGNDGAQYEVLLYVTRKNQPFTPVRKSLTTPVVLKGGKVIGWGANADQGYR